MSLYDSLYGTDIIEQSEDSASQRYDPLRGEMVIKYGREFLEKHFSLESLEWKKITGFKIKDKSLIVLKDEKETFLKDKNKLDPEVRDYLIQENNHTEHHLKDTKELQKKLFDEIKGRIKLDDESLSL